MFVRHGELQELLQINDKYFCQRRILNAGRRSWSDTSTSREEEKEVGLDKPSGQYQSARPGRSEITWSTVKGEIKEEESEERGRIEFPGSPL